MNILTNIIGVELKALVYVPFINKHTPYDFRPIELRNQKQYKVFAVLHISQLHKYLCEGTKLQSTEIKL